MKLSLFPLVLLLAAGSTSCTMTHERDDDYDMVELPSLQKHEAPVELRLSEDFKSYVYEMELADTFVFRMDRTLVGNAESVAEAVFQAPTPENPSRGTLTPRVVSVDDLWEGMTTWSNASLSVEIEWRLEDLDGNLVWLGSEVGIGEGNRGVWVKSAAAERLQVALDQVFLKSAELMAGAPAIDAWAGQ